MSARVRVEEVWRYPVKSLRGERLETAEFVANGVRWDRGVRLVKDGKRVSARTVPGLLGLTGGVGSGGEVEIDGLPWRSAEALAVVREVAGPEVELIADPGLSRFDAAPVLVVTDGALSVIGADPRRFRPNLVLAGVPGLAEREWDGARLAVGSVTLEAVHPCERCVVTTIDPDSLEQDPSVLTEVNDRLDGCMGFYFRVSVPGVVRPGDSVTVTA